ncbi:MAG: ComF family protein [Cyanobacteria bacterium P01_D01_bin.128]
MVINLVNALDSISNLFLAGQCPGCDRPTLSAWCTSCHHQLNQCALNQPAADWRGALPVFAWGQYRGALRQAIAALKYHRQLHLAADLGDRMACSWRDHPLRQTLPHQPIIVPIPLHPQREHQRGYNQAALLARTFCQRLNLPLAESGLRRQRATEAQYGLSATARHDNLQGAFTLGDRWRRQRPRSPVILLDDIYTTGATVHAAASTLRAARISVLGTIVLARALKMP